MLLRTLRNCKDTALRASGEVKIGCSLYRVIGELNTALGSVAAVLTGDKTYLSLSGSGDPPERREYLRRWQAIERGELPWPR